MERRAPFPIHSSKLGPSCKSWAASPVFIWAWESLLLCTQERPTKQTFWPIASHPHLWLGLIMLGRNPRAWSGLKACRGC